MTLIRSWALSLCWKLFPRRRSRSPSQPLGGLYAAPSTPNSSELHVFVLPQGVRVFTSRVVDGERVLECRLSDGSTHLARRLSSENAR